MSDTSTRVIVSIIGIPVIIAACFFGHFYFLIFAIAVGLISFYEFSEMVKKKNISVNIPLGILTVWILIINQYRFFVENFTLVLVFVFLVPLIELFRNKGSAVQNIGATLFGTFYIGIFTSCLVFLREFYPYVGNLYVRGGYLIISVLATIWICDSAAYFGGLSLGKHKLFQRVSPKKSWEGAIFGFVFAVLTMVAAHFIALDFLSLGEAIVIGIIVGTVGQVGDLVESLIKRDAGVKDSSSIIPGHGGIFDRFDSLLFSAPVIMIYLKYFAS